MADDMYAEDRKRVARELLTDAARLLAYVKRYKHAAHRAVNAIVSREVYAYTEAELDQMVMEADAEKRALAEFLRKRG